PIEQLAAETATAKAEASRLTEVANDLVRKRDLAGGSPRDAAEAQRKAREAENRYQTALAKELAARAKAAQASKKESGTISHNIQAPVAAPPRPRTERMPVQPATQENIEDLRRRREELSRLAYNRGAELPDDLRDELRELGSVIRNYEIEKEREAGAAIGEPPEYAPPPGVGGGGYKPVGPWGRRKD